MVQKIRTHLTGYLFVLLLSRSLWVPKS